jgi:hypothetical protein
MIFLYTDLTKKGFSDYQIKKKVKDQELYMVKKGIYSTTKDYHYLEYIAKKHPNAVVTLSTACYCYGFIKKERLPYEIATKQKDRKINDSLIKQTFMTDNLYQIGVSKITYQGFNILIYDLERLLIEVVRNKVNLDYDIYHEIINSYQKIAKLLNKNKLNDYVQYFSDTRIIERINKEVFQKV